MTFMRIFSIINEKKKINSYRKIYKKNMII